jgi:putative transcriptional regulator
MKQACVATWISSVAVLLLAGWASGAGADESARPNGILLVARPELTDPNFAETVVLATRHAHGGAVGVILNRPTATTLAEAFPSHAHLRGRPDVVYHGGPVARTTLVIAFRSAERPAQVLPVLDDVYLGVDPGLLMRLLSPPLPPALRVYAGYAGWAPGQLESEIHQRGWYVLEPDAQTIFEMDPRAMWPRLLRRATSRSVRAGPVP